MPKRSPSEFKPAPEGAYPDRLGYTPLVQIPIDFSPQPPFPILSIGPSGDNTVPPKPGGQKSAPTSPPPAPAKPSAGFMRKHGLG